MKEDELINLIPLDENTKQVANDLMKETDIDKVQQLTKLFNLNQAKRNVLRVMKLNSLLDKVSDSMIERFEERPDEFSNNDLLNYMTVVQSSIDRANKSLNVVDEMPAIQVNQQVNIVESDALSRESREKVTEAVRHILDKLKLGAPQQQPVVQAEEPQIKLLKEEEEE